MNRNPVPGIALGKARKPVLTGFPFVHNGDHERGNAGPCLNSLITRFGGNQ
jgi:hypothetical protein